MLLTRDCQQPVCSRKGLSAAGTAVGIDLRSEAVDREKDAGRILMLTLSGNVV